MGSGEECAGGGGRLLQPRPRPLRLRPGRALRKEGGQARRGGADLPARDAQQRHLAPFHAPSWPPSQPLPTRGQKYPVVQKGRGWSWGPIRLRAPAPDHGPCHASWCLELTRVRRGPWGRHCGWRPGGVQGVGGTDLPGGGCGKWAVI
ncbi:Fibrocystin [Manis pentadactyla]|nr:Fibrocystin [Manis pentadactyla]